MKRNSYQSLSLKKKCEIVESVEGLPPSKKEKDVAAEYNIPCSTLSTIMKNKNQLQDNHSFGNSQKKR